jgi:creatinine amidohydrolase
MENPPEETPGWHSSELETSEVMAHNPALVRMDRAVNQAVKRPDWFPDGFIKLDGAPDVEFRGYQYFAFATEHSDFTESGIIGNPFRGTAEKGELVYERFADHLAAALAEFQTVPVTVTAREFRERV